MTTRRAAIYCRISRDREGAGLGVDRQEQDCREAAERLGWTVVAVYRDNDLSAYSGKPRPGYLELLDAVRAGQVDAVLAWHTDRLHRSPTELEEYIEACDRRGVPTHTVKAGPLDLSTPSGRMVARQLGAVARYEVEHMIERQQRAKLQVATEGGWRGGRRPYGYDADGVTVRPAEADEVLRASKAVLAGSALNRLAVEMNGRGLLTSTGQAWRQDTLRRVLMRPRNAGLMELHGDVIGRANWPAIVPEDIWRGVCAILGDPARRTRHSTARRWLGSGLFLCHCGAPVRVSAAGARSGTRPRPAYMCSNGKHVTRTAEEVDAFVAAVVIERLSRADARGLLARPGVDLAALDTEAEALREQLVEWDTDRTEGRVTKARWLAQTELIGTKLARVEQRIGEAIHRGSALVDFVHADDVRAAWEAAGLDRRRAAVDLLMTVTLLPSARGRRKGWRPGESYFDPSTVAIEWRAST